MAKLIITVVPTCPWLSKSDTPFLPVTASEIAKSVKECYLAGASVVSLSMLKDRFGEMYEISEISDVIAKIYDKCPGIIIQVNTEGIDNWNLKDKSTVFGLKAESASLCIDSDRDSWYTEDKRRLIFERLMKEMKKRKIKPQLEVADPDYITDAVCASKVSRLPAPLDFNLIIGNSVTDLKVYDRIAKFLNKLPKDSIWSISGKGDRHMQSVLLGISLGGNVRVGLGDNIYYEGRVVAKNSDFVKRAASVAEICGRGVANPSEARQIMHI